MPRFRCILTLCCVSAAPLALTSCQAVPGVVPAGTGVNSINHIVFLAQENRSFDHYFGQMRQYWAQNGYPDQSFDGLPQFNPSTGATPLLGPAPALPGCDPTIAPPLACSADTTNP